MTANGAPVAAAGPDIQVLRGNATSEEVAAAVVAILARLHSGAAPPASEHRPARRTWGAPAARMTHAPGQRGAGAWRFGV
ncbi:acyl-CoA carboxylase epsilon subunit [Streptomyces gilvosporeus]|uniref:Acyl-CoA carboxylase subunit epsilon n=1 Tax=Streptomyces gilvosporeus TaxID=553510 RepID=A0A1V0TYW9_9ACTN|nr:acyl-CoA carboxylase epsilon subunit [Streptomyces gilvosporeus]ARF57998.1 hypothetical protein B1H19_30800 [Streptomyces gilvosporeus]